MDVLVRNNIIKRTKLMVEIGHRYIKFLGVRYENKLAAVTCCGKVDTSSLTYDAELVNPAEFVKAVNSFIRANRLRNCEINLTIPSEYVVSKIVEVKNIREKDFYKHMKSEQMVLTRANPLTHIIDWAYIGKREQNGDTIHYCLICAAAKSSILPILSEFDERKLNVRLISGTYNNLIHFADLFTADYENINKLFVDFGDQTTRVIVLIEGIPVYCREFNIGYGSFVEALFKETGIGIPEIIKRLQNEHDSPDTDDGFQEVADDLCSSFVREISRITEMFEDENTSITKIIWSGCLPFHVKNALSGGGYISVEEFNLSDVDHMNGTDYMISAQTAQLDSSFNGLVGLAVSTYR